MVFAEVKKKMKAVMKTTQDKGFVFSYTDSPVSLAPTEVLVKIKATSICGSDVHLYDWDKWSSENVVPPLIVGHEASGEIVRIGREVKNLKPGDHVAIETHVWCGDCYVCKIGRYHVCKNTKVVGFDINGTFAEYIKIPEKNAIKISPSLDWDVASLLEPFGNAVQLSGITNYQGKNVFISGMGPIGLMTLWLVKHMGANYVFVSEISNKRANLALKMGADYVINPQKTNVVSTILEETDNVGVDVFLEVSGSAKAINEGFKVLVPGGEAGLLGLHGNPINIDIDEHIILKGISLIGVTGRLIYDTWIKSIRIANRFPSFLKQLITHRYDLEEFEKGISAIKNGDAVKVVLTPREDQ